MPRRVWTVTCQGAHNPKVVGSNPTPATIESAGQGRCESAGPLRWAADPTAATPPEPPTNWNTTTGAKPEHGGPLVSFLSSGIQPALKNVSSWTRPRRAGVGIEAGQIVTPNEPVFGSRRHRSWSKRSPTSASTDAEMIAGSSSSPAARTVMRTPSDS